MFETATRNKFRFPFKGQISVEDLWDLSLENLDAVFKTLNAQVKQASEESLLDEKDREVEIVEQKIAIVKYIVGVKQAEIAKRRDAAKVREQKEKLMALIAKKEDEALDGLTAEQLKQMLANLGD